MRSTSFSALSLLLLSACGSQPQRQSSQLEERVEAPTTLVAAADVRNLAAQVSAAIAAGSGEIAMDAVASILPMQQDQRGLLISGFPEPFQLVCNTEERHCDAINYGRAVSAQLSLPLGLLSDPILDLAATAKARIFQRSESELEFCSVQGLRVRKYFVSRAVDGLNIQVIDNEAKLVVDAGDERDNFPCK